MTQPNQTQYHLELILAIYNLIPYNKKVTAKQIQTQLSPLGLERSLRTIQRNLSAICAMFPNVMVDDRDKPFGYQNRSSEDEHNGSRSGIALLAHRVNQASPA